MKSIRKILLLSAMSAAAAIPVAARAQAGVPSVAAPATNVMGAAADMSDAEVRKVDKDNKKITLKHGEIKSLDMPPMTMVFLVKDAKMLEQVKVGDKVRFKAVNEGGKMTVTEIAAAK